MSQPNKLLTLLFVLEGDRVLLGLKKRGFGVGKWNGFGGKVQGNECIEDAAKRFDMRTTVAVRVWYLWVLLLCLRETEEECGLLVSDLDEAGVIVFDMGPGYPDQLLEVHVFRTETYSGTVAESEGGITNMACYDWAILLYYMYVFFIVLCVFIVMILSCRNEATVVQVF